VQQSGLVTQVEMDGNLLFIGLTIERYGDTAQMTINKSPGLVRTQLVNTGARDTMLVLALTHNTESNWTFLDCDTLGPRNRTAALGRHLEALVLP
jgi:hypothetical protein